MEVGAIRKVNYSHDSMIDKIIENPWVTQNELAAYYGYTPGWVSQVIASDAFQSRLAQRKDELIDPAIKATIEERFKALVIQSYEVLKRKLESPAVPAELALKSLDVAAKALGYGAKNSGVQINNNNFVVQVPTKAASSAAWVGAHAEHPPIEAAAMRVDAPPTDIPVSISHKPDEVSALLGELDAL
jgi:hypothetical protein